MTMSTPPTSAAGPAAAAAGSSSGAVQQLNQLPTNAASTKSSEWPPASTAMAPALPSALAAMPSDTDNSSTASHSVDTVASIDAGTGTKSKFAEEDALAMSIAADISQMTETPRPHESRGGNNSDNVNANINNKRSNSGDLPGTGDEDVDSDTLAIQLDQMLKTNDIKTKKKHTSHNNNHSERGRTQALHSSGKKGRQFLPGGIGSRSVSTDSVGLEFAAVPSPHKNSKLTAVASDGTTDITRPPLTQTDDKGNYDKSAFFASSTNADNHNNQSPSDSAVNSPPASTDPHLITRIASELDVMLKSGSSRNLKNRFSENRSSGRSAASSHTTANKSPSATKSPSPTKSPNLNHRRTHGSTVTHASTVTHTSTVSGSSSSSAKTATSHQTTSDQTSVFSRSPSSPSSSAGFQHGKTPSQRSIELRVLPGDGGGVDS
jgi:hypothetical protein